MNENTEAATTVEAPQSDAERVEVGTVVTDPSDAGTVNVEALKAALAAKEAELLEFQREVAVTTSRYAKAHGLCSVVDSALAELGLQRPRNVHRVTVNLQFALDMALSADRTDEPTASEVWSAVHQFAYILRTCDPTEAASRMTGDAFGNIEISAADFDASPLNSGSAHLRPGGRTKTCPSCSCVITSSNPMRNRDRNCRSCY